MQIFFNHNKNTFFNKYLFSKQKQPITNQTNTLKLIPFIYN